MTARAGTVSVNGTRRISVLPVLEAMKGGPLTRLAIARIALIPPQRTSTIINRWRSARWITEVTGSDDPALQRFAIGSVDRLGTRAERKVKIQPLVRRLPELFTSPSDSHTYEEIVAWAKRENDDAFPAIVENWLKRNWLRKARGATEYTLGKHGVVEFFPGEAVCGDADGGLKRVLQAMFASDEGALSYFGVSEVLGLPARESRRRASQWMREEWISGTARGYVIGPRAARAKRDGSL